MSEQVMTKSNPVCNGRGWVKQDSGDFITCRGCEVCKKTTHAATAAPVLELVRGTPAASTVATPAPAVAPTSPAAAPVKGRCASVGQAHPLSDQEKRSRRTKCPGCSKTLSIKDNDFQPDFNSMLIPRHMVAAGVAKPETALAEKTEAQVEAKADHPAPQKIETLAQETLQEPITIPTLESMHGAADEFPGEDYPAPDDYGPSPHDVDIDHYDRAPLPYLAPDALPTQLPIETIVPAAAVVVPAVVDRVAHTVAEVEAAGGYSVIYADCAWAYSNKGRGSTDGKYDGMPTKDILAMPVSRIASKNAVCFHWVTGPFLKVGIDVLEAWGFEYLTIAFTWVKYHEGSYKRCVGGGFWTRANVELCLLGVRGTPPRRVDKAVRQLIESGPLELADGGDVLLAPRGEHSAKPTEARERIHTLMGNDVSMIELFARDRVEYMDAWGNDPKLGGSDIIL